MTYNHASCTHPATKVARAACRREHARHDDIPAQRNRRSTGTRLPSMIAPKVRPIIDAAKERGLTVRLSYDTPAGVEQMFVIRPKGKATNCEIIAEAFASVVKGREGKAAFFIVRDDKSRQLSKSRVMAELDALANA